MTTEPTDEELEQFMGENSSLSRRYRESHGELPPAKLDDHILAAARAKRDASNNNKRRLVKRPAWTIPVSIAAIMVLSVSLVTTMQQQTTEPMPMSVTDEMEIEAASAGANVKKRESSLSEPALEKREFEQKSARQVPPAADIILKETSQQSTPLKRPMSAESVELMQDYSADTMPSESRVQAEVDPATTSSLMQGSVPERGSLTDEEAILIRKLRELIAGEEVVEARQVVRDFRKANPTYSDAALLKLIGKDWYQLLLTE